MLASQTTSHATTNTSVAPSPASSNATADVALNGNIATSPAQPPNVSQHHSILPTPSPQLPTNECIASPTPGATSPTITPDSASILAPAPQTPRRDATPLAIPTSVSQQQQQQQQGTRTNLGQSHGATTLSLVQRTALVFPNVANFRDVAISVGGWVNCSSQRLPAQQQQQGITQQPIPTDDATASTYCALQLPQIDLLSQQGLVFEEGPKIRGARADAAASNNSGNTAPGGVGSSNKPGIFIKPFNLFRSARLDSISAEELDVLTNMFSIRCVIDLRSENETKSSGYMTDCFPASFIDEELVLRSLVHSQVAIGHRAQLPAAQPIVIRESVRALSGPPPTIGSFVAPETVAGGCTNSSVSTSTNGTQHQIDGSQHDTNDLDTANLRGGKNQSQEQHINGKPRSTKSTASNGAREDSSISVSSEKKQQQQKVAAANAAAVMAANGQQSTLGNEVSESPTSLETTQETTKVPHIITTTKNGSSSTTAATAATTTGAISGATAVVTTTSGDVNGENLVTAPLSGIPIASYSTSSSIRPATRVTYKINFAGNNFRKCSVWKPLSKYQKMKVIALMLSGNKPKVIEMVGRDILQPRGLLGLNKNFVDYSGQEIVQVLRLMTFRENYPILVHCTQGKDRTGLIIALALYCAGVKESLIFRDYHRSQKGLDAKREEMVREMAKTGLGAEFADAPIEVMEKTFAYIREKYGSIDRYLDRNGFFSGDRLALRNCLVYVDLGK